MQSVILAGGLGTRLWPVTREIPKPMVPVCGVPYLEHQLRLLFRQDMTDIVLLTGYLGEQIEAYFGNGAGLGLRIRYSHEQSPLGTGGALRRARSILDESFLLIYGDSYLPIDYRAVLDALAMSSAAGVVVVYDNRLGDTSVKNNVAVEAGNWVSTYDKDAIDGSRLDYVEAGVLAFRRSVVDCIPPGHPVSLERTVFPQLIAKRQLLGYPTKQRFYDIGTPERLRTIEQVLSV